MSTESRPRSASLCAGSRRDFLAQFGAGFTGLALSGLLEADGFFARPDVAASVSSDPMRVKPPHLPTKAKACIFLFMYGGPSQMDLFDYKPELNRRHGQTASLEQRRRDVKPGTLLGSKRTFRQYGQSGLWCSDVLPHLSGHMDKLAVVKSLYADSFAHGSAMIQMNSGRVLQGWPSMGSWLSYGLGSANANLPGYVVMLDPRGGPISGAANWSSGFMPAAYQGTVFRASGNPILNLDPADGSPAQVQRDTISTLNELNAGHLAARPGFSELQARIASYELAFNMQRHAPEAVDLGRESESTRELYGINNPRTQEFGRRCLLARRLVERGVRFVQLYAGGAHNDDNWDAHSDLEKNHNFHAGRTDRPIAGLLQDLKQRGLLDETLVIWGGEFGRQPTAEYEKGTGRDHNAFGFTMWMAGGGVKGGQSIGATDELGLYAVDNRISVNDFHATILHMLGLDHEKLTILHSGKDERLTDVAGNVITKVFS